MNMMCTCASTSMNRTSRSCKVTGDNKAEMQLINDFGSEDLRATLTRKNDSLYVLKQGAGSTIKVPHQGKWRKLPGTLTFTRK